MKLSQTKAKREISLHHCFRGRFKTRFFLPIFPSIFLKNHEMENSYNFLTILLPHVLCAREWEKKGQIFKNELHKSKVEQSRLCMLFQVPIQNQHLSMKNHSQNHMQNHFTKMREREKICIWFSPKRNSRMLQNKRTKLFSFYYNDISQHSTHFHLVLLREVFWQKKQTLLINWYVSCANRKNRTMLY